MRGSEQEQGYAACNCGKFAFVFRAELLCFKPKDYPGELCLSWSSPAGPPNTDL
jgi:hypothetical protein